MNSRPPRPISREALYAHADAYLAALAAKDASRLPWADHVVFTENNVQLAVGDGAWNTISAVRPGYDLKAADPETGQVSWFGVVEEHGHPAIMAVRLAITDGLIAEAETIVCRKVDLSPFPGIDTYISPRPLMQADVPPEQRRERARMISIADGYFDTLQLNDGTLFTEFTDDCDRIENGVQTTNNIDAFPNYPIAGLGCAEQFRKGHFVFDDRLRDRRFPLVDEEKGLVLAGGFIDHTGKRVELTWTDGTTAHSVFHYPHSFSLLELFKIVDGKIAGVEAVFVTVPYNMPSPWS
ncbi:MAG TPA: hypothetical protein VNR60_03570 [Croceibacterium sp.]|nr:hypothetical protein [Croceibacterium sp.]